MRSFPKSAVQRQLMLTSALAVPVVFGYAGRQAYAACSALGGGTYLCSGTLRTTQTINADNADVTMASGASIDTTGGTGNAITVTGNGALSFINTTGGLIQGEENAIDVRSTGDDGAIRGAVTINVTGDVSAVKGYGINALNESGSSGSITVTAAGVTSATKDGIYARNRTTAGRDLTITTTGTVSGKKNGINARNDGTGRLTVTTADVAGGSGSGILAWNEGTDLSVRATGTVTVTGTGSGHDTRAGVVARNYGSGSLTIETVDVSASGGSEVDGIFADNAFGTDLSITATGAVTAENNGITATNRGSGSLSITAADVRGSKNDGIYGLIESTGTNLWITATGGVSGGRYGVFAKNEGSGVVTVTTATVTGGAKDGIYVRNSASGTDITITANGPVTGEERGIYARNDGTGNTTLTVTTAAGVKNSGILAKNFNSAGDLTITATGAVSGASSGLYARNFGTGALRITTYDVEGFDGDHPKNTANGINAEAHGTGLTITSSGTVSGTRSGIAARNMGTGSATISAVNATGGTTEGIYALNSFTGTDLTVTSTGRISGATNGIRAQNDGTGTTSVTAHDVFGTNNDGIYVLGASTSADITITGSVYGGRNGVGLGVAGLNTITITGTGALSGGDKAINTTVNTPVSDDTVVNYGTVTGDVDLGGGTNSFDNRSGGLFKSASTVNLGAGNTLTNEGDLSPGGTGTIQTTALTGNFVQTSSGTFSVDMNSEASTVDRINISGTATLSGNVKVNPLNLVDPTKTLTILSAAGGVTNNGLTARDTVVVDYTLVFPNATDVAIGNQYIDFTPVAPDGTSQLRTQNERNVGANMNAIYSDGGGAMHDLQLELMKIESIEAYQKALDRLHGEHYLVQVGAAIGSLHSFRESLLSCPSRLDGVAVAAADDYCLWGRVQGHRVDIRQTTSTIGGGETSYGFSGGLEVPLGDGMRVGVAGTVETSELSTNNSGTSDGMRYTIGAKFEKTWGALEASLGGYGGLAQYDTDRQVGLGFGTASSDQTISFAGIVSRLSYAFDTGTFRVVPMVDVAATRVGFGDVRETGAGSANLTISGSNDWILTATPAVGVMGTLHESPGYRINGSMKTGVSFFSNNEYRIHSRFTEAPSGVPSFVTTTKLDTTIMNLSAALELQKASGTSFKLAYTGSFGSVSRSNGGYLRAIVPF
jgi:hypothetical protein